MTTQEQDELTADGGIVLDLGDELWAAIEKVKPATCSVQDWTLAFLQGLLAGIERGRSEAAA